MKSPRFPGLNSSSMVMVEFSSSFEPGQGELVPVFGGESLTDSGMEDWDIALWLQSLEQSQLCLPFWSLHHCGGKRGTGSEKKAADMQSTDLCVLPILMKPLRTPKSEDTINEYCYEHFKGDFECTLAEGKGRRHCWIASLSEVSWANNLKLIARRRHPVHILNLPGSWLPRRRLLKVNCFFRSFLECPKDVTIIHNSSEVCDLWWCMRDMSDMSIISTHVTHGLLCGFGAILWSLWTHE